VLNLERGRKLYRSKSDLIVVHWTRQGKHEVMLNLILFLGGIRLGLEKLL
jgi:hypothetical protein